MSEFVTDDAWTEKKKKKKAEKKQKIRRDAVRFTKVVSLVGIRHATDERNSSVRRCVWLLWLVFGIGFAVFQIVTQVTDYYEYKAKIQNKITVIKNLSFPQVTICNENTMMPDEAKDYGVTNFTDTIDKMLATLRNGSLDHETTMSELWRTVNEYHQKTKDWETKARELAQSRNDTILKISFNDTNINETSFDLYVEEILTDLGYCYAFGTKNRPLFSTREGAMNGLIVVLNANRQKFAFNSTAKPGYKILIHDPEEIPLLKEAGFSLEIGMIARVKLALRHVKLQGHPYDKCNKSDGTAYRTSQCHAKKDYEAFRSRCNCSDPFMRGAINGTTNTTDDTGFETCSYAQIINCTVIADSLCRINTSSSGTFNSSTSPNCFSSSSASSDGTHSADKKCDPQCNNPTFTTSVSMSSFPLLMNEVSRIPAEAQVQNRFRVQVYYPHMSFIQANSSPAKTDIELFCDISGALSLLLGATLLTVYEAIEFVVLFCKNYAKFYFRR